MDKSQERLVKITSGDIFLPPNLMSIARILLTIPLGYFLAVGSNQSTLICVILLIVAGITDYMDGFLARRLNQRTLLGLYLDPLADKFMVIIIMIELIFTREFPIWMAITVILRDLLILTGGFFMKRKKNFMPYSFITGKYYFSALAVLMGSYIIRFDFGIKLMFVITIILMILSFYYYFNRFILIISDKDVASFKDKPVYVFTRTILTLIVSVAYLYKLYIDIISKYV